MEKHRITRDKILNSKFEVEFKLPENLKQFNTKEELIEYLKSKCISETEASKINITFNDRTRKN